MPFAEALRPLGAIDAPLLPQSPLVSTVIA